MLRVGAKATAKYTDAGSNPNLTVTPGITTVTGLPIVVFIVHESTAGQPTLSDSNSNTWTQIGTQVVGDADATIYTFRTLAFRCDNPTGGAGHTFTATSSGGYASVFVVQCEGAEAFDVHAVAADTATPFTSGTLAPTNANALLLACWGSNGAALATFTANNGFRIDVQQTDGAAAWSGGIASRAVSEAGSYEASIGTSVSPAEGVAWIIALTEADPGTNPVTGAHTYVGQEEGSGSSPATTPAIATQVSGSSFITAHAGYTSNNAAPTDTKSNTWTAHGSEVYAGYGGAFNVRMYVAEDGAGGNDHTVSFTKTGYAAGEATVPLIEVRNADTLVDVAQNYPLIGNALTSGSVTTTGPAVLVAFWWGDGLGLTHSATPNNGFAVVESFGNLPPNSAVQMVVATREVTTAGTYDVTWTESPDQGAALWLFAFQQGGGGSFLAATEGADTFAGAGDLGPVTLRDDWWRIQPSGRALREYFDLLDLPDTAAQSVAARLYFGEPTGWTLAATEGADTAAATGSVVASGALAASEFADAFASVGSVIVAGSLAASEGSDTASASGDVRGVGTLAVTEGSDTASAAGSVLASGGLAATEGADTFAGDGELGTVSGGSLAATEGADTATATGSVLASGALAASEGADAASANGSVQAIGALATTEAGDSAAGVGTVIAGGSLVASEAGDVAAFSGTAIVPGTLAATEGADSFAAIGDGASLQGTLAATEAADAVAVAGLAFTQGALAASEGADTAALVGGLIATASLAASEGADTAAALGSIVVAGVLAASELADVFLAMQASTRGRATVTARAIGGASVTASRVGTASVSTRTPTTIQVDDQ